MEKLKGSPASGKASYFQNLDGLRAIAAFCVIFAHLAYWFKYPDNYFFDTLTFLMSFGGNLGRIGVICFFVLSGFLITYLMFTEETREGKLNVIYFYIRRILRIWPLYFLTLFIGFIVYPLILKAGGHPHHENASWLMYAVFAANFDHIWNYFPTSNMLGVQWSVAVEEQFYLVWPLLFVLLNKKKIFPWLLGFIILCSETYSIRTGSHIAAGDYHFLSCIRYLSYGALLAWWSFHKKELLAAILNKIKKPAVILIYLSCIGIMMLQNYITLHFPGYIYLYHLAPVLFSMYIIAEQNFSENSFFRLGNFKTLSWLGRISYGLYLTHMIAINIILAVMPPDRQFSLLGAIAALLLCISISYLSYTYFESYFLSLKKKFSFVEKR